MECKRHYFVCPHQALHKSSSSAARLDVRPPVQRPAVTAPEFVMYLYSSACVRVFCAAEAVPERAVTVSRRLGQRSSTGETFT